nr:GNAT family N-acetyltransferase [Hyphomicrobiales bacterium]
KDVTADNWEAVVDLELREEQQNLVASNAVSIAESKFNPYAVPKAIYAGKKLVGFVMYESCDEDDKPHDYTIYRFMIDKKHQGKGYGRAGLECALDLIRKDRELERIEICYVPENAASRNLYASLGFVETGLDEDGEMIAEIVVKQQK